VLSLVGIGSNTPFSRYYFLDFMATFLPSLSLGLSSLCVAGVGFDYTDTVNSVTGEWEVGASSVVGKEYGLLSILTDDILETVCIFSLK
jgi:hypothetical protein